MKNLICAGLCLGLLGCGQEVSRSAGAGDFNPVHVGASPQFLDTGVSVSLAEAQEWAWRAPIMRGGQTVRTSRGEVVMQRVRYDAFEMAVVDVDAAAGYSVSPQDLAVPLEMATGCAVAEFDHAETREVPGRAVIPLEC